MESNNAKLREAVEATYHELCLLSQELAIEKPAMSHIIACAAEKCRAALAEPVKNNEVGTVEKQAARHHAWCRRHGINGDNKVDCAHPDIRCDL